MLFVHHGIGGSDQLDPGRVRRGLLLIGPLDAGVLNPEATGASDPNRLLLVVDELRSRHNGVITRRLHGQLVVVG